MPITIKRETDPFKKYWWVILLVFGLIGAWVCLPLMEPGTGSVAVKETGLQSAEQSLDSAFNPSGAPGGSVNLSMEGSGAYRKKDASTMKSSLYEPADDEEPTAAVSANAAVAAPGQSFADALKAVSSKKAAEDPSGWGGAKAQKGFTAPKANFGSMSGFGGSSGSGASASSSLSGGAPQKASAFGASGPNTGVSFAKGLGAKGDEQKGGMMNALKAAAGQSVAAANAKSADMASAMGGGSFDGSGGRGGGIDGGASSSDGGGGVYGNLDAAPVNLKVNDPTLNASKYEPPPVDKKEVKDPNDEMRKMIMQMIIMAVVGGLVSGITGAIFPAAGAAGAAKPAALDDPRHWT